jgi:hypothetical protein
MVKLPEAICPDGIFTPVLDSLERSSSALELIFACTSVIVT